VVKPNSEIVPAGVWIACHSVLVGVGVTSVTAGLEAAPPNVAVKAAVKRAMSPGAT